MTQKATMTQQETFPGCLADLCISWLIYISV